MKAEEKKRIIRITSLIIALGLILFVSINTAEAKKLLSYILTVLSPFIYGAVIAFILNIVVKPFDNALEKLDKKRGKETYAGKHRKLSIILSILVFVAFVALTIGMIIPNLKNTVQDLYHDAPELWEKFLDFVDSFKEKKPKLAPYITSIEDNLDVYVDKFVVWGKSKLSDLAGTALDKVKSAGNVIFNLFAGFIIAFVVLVRKEPLVRNLFTILKKILPAKDYRRTSYVIRLANKKFQIFFKYNFVQAAITGFGTFLVMLVSGMPYKISISLLITVTQLIPIIGAVAGTAVSALLIAAVSPVKAIIFIVLCILVQQAVEKLINPHLMGKELEMPGIITFLAIILGGKQFGLIGLFCAVPFVSVFYDLYTLKLRPRIFEDKVKTKDKKDMEM